MAVAREGSVSRAAEVLNLTQPAISHQIKRLSEETGIALFKRTATGLRTTHPDIENALVQGVSGDVLKWLKQGRIGLSLCRDAIALHQKQSFGLAVCDKVSVPACLGFVTLGRRKTSPVVSETFTLLQGCW